MCACKQKSQGRQATAVKQVVKKVPSTSAPAESSRPQRKVIANRTIFKRGF